MALGEAENNRLKHVLETLTERRDEMNDFERGFVADQVDRYEKYKANIFMSEKQWNVLNKAYKAVTGEEPT